LKKGQSINQWTEFSSSGGINFFYSFFLKAENIFNIY